MAEYNTLVQDFNHVADFVTVYISEAHPLDEWGLNHERYSRNQQMNLTERLSSAEMMKAEGMLGNIVVESMDNESIDLYASLPDRLVVVVDNVIEYKSGLGPFGYKPDQSLRKWLQKWTTKQVNNVA
ncbi:Iodothyronine deiodinase [Mactra antiquata]